MPFFESTLSQDDLIEGCIRNDRRAQELLYKQYCQALLALCTSYAKNEEDAVEILQDGFLKVFKQIATYDPARSSLYTWMRTIMVRTAIDALRKGKNEAPSVEWDESHDTPVEAGALEQMSTREIQYFLHQLPETTRTVFNLFVTEGYSHKEIAALLDFSEGTSRWYLSEARKHLMQALKTKERA